MAMAAAAAATVAVKHNQNKQQLVLHHDHDMPPRDSCLLSAVLGRQVIGPLGVSWQPREVRVAQDRICIGKKGVEENGLLDYIPISEVVSIEGAAHSHKASRHASMVNLFQKARAEHDDEEDSENAELVFSIHTAEEGVNAGKTTIFQTRTAEECQRWINVIDEIATQCKNEREEKENREMGLYKRYKKKARFVYNSKVVQFGTGAIILASYISAMAGSQALPDPGSAMHRQLRIVEWIFTILFTLELMLNMFANWWWPFWQDGWNCFDFIVVAVSLVGLGYEGLPAINVLRLIRVFKMMRLFTKLKSLRMLINALAASVIPVINSFMILMLITSIYAVVATDLFRDRSEFFFDFSQSLYSLFQIATGDAWSSQIVRPLMDEYDSGSVYKGWTALFFVSYVLVVGVVLMNIVVAVLLDEFISTVAAEKANARAEEQEKRDKEKVVNAIAEGPLDALVRSLLAYTTKDDLHRRIFNLYQRVDLDQSGGINLEEMNLALKKLKHGGNLIQLSEDEWSAVTNRGSLLNEDGELTASAFETMMMTQIKGFSHRKIQSALSRSTDEDENIMFGLKIIMSSVDHMEHMHELMTRQSAGAMQTHLKSKKMVLNKLFRRPLTMAIERWKEHCFRAQFLDDDGPETSADAATGHDQQQKRGWSEMFEAAEHHGIKLREEENVGAAGVTVDAQTELSVQMVAQRLAEISVTLQRLQIQQTLQAQQSENGMPRECNPHQSDALLARDRAPDVEQRLAGLEEGMSKILSEQGVTDRKLEHILRNLDAIRSGWRGQNKEVALAVTQADSVHARPSSNSPPRERKNVSARWPDTPTAEDRDRVRRLSSFVASAAVETSNGRSVEAVDPIDLCLTPRASFQFRHRMLGQNPENRDTRANVAARAYGRTDSGSDETLASSAVLGYLQPANNNM